MLNPYKVLKNSQQLAKSSESGLAATPAPLFQPAVILPGSVERKNCLAQQKAAANRETQQIKYLLRRLTHTYNRWVLSLR
jgi:hypothetical protein